MAVGKLKRARQAVFDAYDAIDEAEARLQVQLKEYRRLRAVSRRHLAEGGTASSLRDVIDIKDARVKNDEALAQLAAARVRAQFALYRLAAAEGMSAAEIGRTWGVSRQFASRVVNGGRAR